MYVSSNGVYRTTNGGQSWVSLGPFHSDNIVLTFNANRQLLVGGDGGLYVNTSGTTLVPQHTGLPITEFYSIAAHPANGLLMAGGTQDNGTVQFQGSLGWYELVGGDGGDVVFDPNPQQIIVYAEVEWYFDQGSNVFSFFRCQPTSGCLSRNTGIDLTVNGPFIPRMALDISNPATLWLTAEKLFRTDNRANSWVAASPSIGLVQRCWQDPAKGRLCANGGYFTAAAVAPSNSQTVYAGALNGDVWLTTNKGATWTSIAGPNAGPLPVRNVNDIVVDPLDSRIAYVAYSGFDSGGSGVGHSVPDDRRRADVAEPDGIAAGHAGQHDPDRSGFRLERVAGARAVRRHRHRRLPIDARRQLAAVRHRPAADRRQSPRVQRDDEATAGGDVRPRHLGDLEPLLAMSRRLVLGCLVALAAACGGSSTPPAPDANHDHRRLVGHVAVRHVRRHGHR